MVAVGADGGSHPWVYLGSSGGADEHPLPGTDRSIFRPRSYFAVLGPRRGDVPGKAVLGPVHRPRRARDGVDEVGLGEVEQTALTIRMEFGSFADYWEPWLGGQGTVGAYVASLSEAKRRLIEHHLRLAYLAGGEDGPRSFAATAWAVRGVKPGGSGKSEGLSSMYRGPV